MYSLAIFSARETNPRICPATLLHVAAEGSHGMSLSLLK
jgi:hypothetical protein